MRLMTMSSLEWSGLVARSSGFRGIRLAAAPIPLLKGNGGVVMRFGPDKAFGKGASRMLDFVVLLHRSQFNAKVLRFSVFVAG